MSITKLIEKAKTFELSEDYIADQEAGRQSFISKFPIERIDELTPDQYAAGTDKNSFCYWLEFNNILFGIGGGNASKFGIYKAKDGPFYKGTQKNKRTVEGQELTTVFDKIKTGTLQAIRYTAEDKIEEIHKLNIPVWNMVLQKILAIYFPEKFIMVGASDVLIEAARFIELKGIELKPENLVFINYELKKEISKHPFFEDWSYIKIGRLIWETFYDDSKRNYYVLGSKYGNKNNIDIFPEMHKQAVIATGFAKHIDLTKYFSKSPGEIVEYLKKHGEEGKSYNALKYFLTLKPGDRVAVKGDGSPKGKKGFLSILGIAEVVEKNGKVYTYDPDGLGHLLHVKFIKAPVYKEFEIGGFGRTIQKVSKPEMIKAIFKSEYVGDEQKSIEPSDTIMKFPLNTIFYGPPGTGKTYKTIIRSAQIIEQRKIEDFCTAKNIFNNHLRDRIEFITFHQNYSYEDFIQGLRPITENEQDLRFEKTDGIFKRIADKALENLKDAATTTITQKSFEEVFNTFLLPMAEGDADEIEVKMKKVSYAITHVSDRAIEFRKASGGTAHNLSIAKLKGMYEEQKLMASKGLGIYYNPLLRKLFELGKLAKAESANIKKQNYVIIIDEINRANISRVFGELITLIEPDKRSHGAIPLSATLPSGDVFKVPSNLYIIGTMNTADKSIALLDIALRRRFEFEAMYPRYDISQQPIHEVDVFKSINKSIIAEKGHDFQIGHAYFMGDDFDLTKNMNKKVIPLLLEYFMNDEKAVSAILNNAGLIIKADHWPLEIEGKKGKND